MAAPDYYDVEKRLCPDDGTCHHHCQAPECFRVAYCVPLSAYSKSDEWPAEIVAKHGTLVPLLPGVDVLYRHYKGGLYRVLAVATMEGSSERYVTYVNAANGRAWVRPLSQWFQKVQPNAGDRTVVPRFVREGE